MTRPLAPIVWEYGVPTYAAVPPSDFFTRQELASQYWLWKTGRGPRIETVYDESFHGIF